MGWQRQSHGPSVQASIERALAEITSEDIAVHAAGRTDAGVHATGMRVHCDVARTIEPFRLMEAMNARLRPDPVAILDCRVVPDDWHARFSCVRRRYAYHIVSRRAPLTHMSGLAWRVPQSLDTERMQDAAKRLIGRHDFTTFRSAHCQADSPLRTLERLDVVLEDGRIVIHAEARSFLHHQVRSMVGCLSMVGQGRRTADELAAILDARDRTALWFNAPPDGLFFVGADY